MKVLGIIESFLVRGVASGLVTTFLIIKVRCPVHGTVYEERDAFLFPIACREMPTNGRLPVYRRFEASNFAATPDVTCNVAHILRVDFEIGKPRGEGGEFLGGAHWDGFFLWDFSTSRNRGRAHLGPGIPYPRASSCEDRSLGLDAQVQRFNNRPGSSTALGCRDLDVEFRLIYEAKAT